VTARLSAKPPHAQAGSIPTREPLRR